MAKKYLIRHDDDSLSAELREEDGRFEIRTEGSDTWREVHLDRAGDSGLYLLMVNNRPVEIYLERRRGGATATIGRHAFDCDVGPWRPLVKATPRNGGAGPGVIRLTAPMTGSIVDVRCGVGETVQEGAVLVIIESMKMNNEVRAPEPGVVDSVNVAAGQRVSAGAALVVLRTEGSG